MKKMKYIISIFVGLVIGTIAIIQDRNILFVLVEPIELALNYTEKIIQQSTLGLIVAWIILLILSFTPFLIMYRYKKQPYQLSLYFVIGVTLLVAQLLYFNPKFSNIPQIMQIMAVGFLYASIILGIVFELFIRDTKRPQDILKAMVILLMIFLSSTIPLAIKEIEPDGILSIITFIVEFVLLTHLLHLLHHVDEFLETKEKDMFNDASVDKLQTISKYANHMLSYSVYITIFLNVLRFFLTEDAVHFDFNIPYVEMLFTSIIALFIHLLVQVISLKNEVDPSF
ncbi:MAG: hypothetical protein GX038_03085 [Erysipelothrix sp.]|nr:hypothetical protein [Erysipelothrix sp.]